MVTKIVLCGLIFFCAATASGQELSKDIHLNQVGFYTDAPKAAVLTVPTKAGFFTSFVLQPVILLIKEHY